MGYSKLEKRVMESALLDYIDKTQKSLVKKMRDRCFPDYQPPALGIETDENFMEEAKKHFPDTTEKYLTIVKLYNEI